MNNFNSPSTGQNGPQLPNEITFYTPQPDPPQPHPTIPPLPIDPIQPFPREAFPFPRIPWPPRYKLRNLKCGAYLINFQPVSSRLVTYDGTMRVECHKQGITASGDLYRRGWFFSPFTFPPRPPLVLGAPNPSAGIPIFKRSSYSYYLRVTQILEYFTFGNSFTLGFELHRYTKNPGGFTSGGTWTNEGPVTARMTWTTAPLNYPSPNDYLTGEVVNAAGRRIGSLTMGWISKYLRKATVEIDRVSQSEAPLNSGSGINWKTVGDAIGWDITVDQSDANIAEVSGNSWSNAEVHQSLLTNRDQHNLDREWRYYVMAVRNLDATSRGIMFDAGATDSNNVPREGCAIASHWNIPNTNMWGLVRGMRFGTAAAPYFRTAVHEIGHAMGLYHNRTDNGFMNTTGTIVGSGGSPFPNNIQWSFNPADAKRLRHFPDIYVRPGATPWATPYSSTPISPNDENDALLLHASTLSEALPLGAPLRVDLKLSNVSDQPIAAPHSLSMKRGHVKGYLQDQHGNQRTFKPLIICMDDVELSELAPGASIFHSITLLRGPEGALLPAPGRYQIVIEVHWDIAGLEMEITTESSIIVTPATDEAHYIAAQRVLSSTDALLTLALGGDHMKDGVQAIQRALEDPILAPHYSYIEAKRLAEPFRQRAAEPDLCAALIDQDTVMNAREKIKSKAFMKPTKKQARTKKPTAALTRPKAKKSKLV